MPKTCIYAGFRHLFYQMALLWLYLLGGVVESILRIGIENKLTQVKIDDIFINKITRRAYK